MSDEDGDIRRHDNKIIIMVTGERRRPDTSV